MVGGGSYDDGADKNDDRGGGVDPGADDRGIEFYCGRYWSPELYFKNSVKILLPVIVAQA